MNTDQTSENIFTFSKKYIIYAKKGFNTDDDNKKHNKVRYHRHHTGKYRGASHVICNLRYKKPQKIRVVFHNGSTYDYKFVIKGLTKKFNG